jgi:magnesium transporter
MHRCFRHHEETTPVIKFHIADKGTLYSGPPDLTHPVPPEVLWIDICSPTRAEEAELERALGLDVPTREEISEIEQTSRLYRSNGLLYMTAVIIARSDSLAPTTVPVTFIATPERVITVRYDTPTSFEIFQARCEKRTVEIASASDVLTGLLGTIVDRAADILELVGADLEALNREIFLYTGAKAKRSSAKQPQRRNLEEVIGDVGRSHDVVSRIRESLQSLERLFVFLRNNGAPWPDETERQVAALEEDVRSLSEFDGFLSNKVEFMLDATLGLVGIQQNGIIKIFSVIAVVFMPPTLVASIYGMNFEHMPELKWLLGYPWALLLMLLSAVCPYLFFRWRGWL